MTKMTLEEMEFVQAHLKMLNELQKSGYNCNREIKETLDKLHSSMFPKEEKDDSKVRKFKRMVTNRLNYPVPKGSEAKFRLVTVGEEDRGIGKTESIIEMAKKYGLSVVVPHRDRTVYGDVRGREYVKCYTVNEALQTRGLRFLLEEGLEFEDIVKLKNCPNLHIVGGYISNDYLETI